MRSLLLLAVLSIVACGGDNGTGPSTPPPVPSATGTWLGNAVTDFGANRFITLALQENGQTVSGTCSVAVSLVDPPYWTCSVSGAHDHPSLDLTLTEPTFAPLTITGTFTDANTYSATLSGTAGWTNTPVTFMRQ
jgi:hypothetical protein